MGLWEFIGCIVAAWFLFAVITSGLLSIWVTVAKNRHRDWVYPVDFSDGDQ